uniref:Thymidine diphospho-4-keto-rhamnose 3,5-epimerase n=1 Tax=Rhabditophanes sp. KR3021 TaxID=114890 RepID=A0AC35TKN7_9BILA
MSIPAVDKRFTATIESFDTIPDLKLIRPKCFPDERGFFAETYNKVEFAEKLDFHEDFKQDNHSFSTYGVVRGLHTQPGMGKLVSVVSGTIYDVAVDVRPGSATFGQWKSTILDSKSKTQFWIPSGFLHGFQCISEEGAHVTYKCSGVYDPKTEFGINPFDEELAVQWPITDTDKIIYSERDKQHPAFSSLKQ